MNLTKPVVLIIFNRPKLTEVVFQAIREAKPPKLFLVADGPRPNRPDDIPRCAAARKVVEKVDWDCEVLRNYADENMGCGCRPASGITWVFSQVEEAIILEDDCVPSPSFFPFCQELLDRYRTDERVMHIGGMNWQSGHRRSPFSYFFSKYPQCWGWATWRRAWAHYDFTMRYWRN